MNFLKGQLVKTKNTIDNENDGMGDFIAQVTEANFIENDEEYIKVKWITGVLRKNGQPRVSGGWFIERFIPVDLLGDEIKEKQNDR